MLSRLERLLASSSRADVQIQLDRREPIYTNQDTVSGHILLHNESSIHISTINVTLSGIATSRLGPGKRIESHQACFPRLATDRSFVPNLLQLLQKTQQVFPPCRTSEYLTLGHGTHTFPFSITVSKLRVSCHYAPILTDLLWNI